MSFVEHPRDAGFLAAKKSQGAVVAGGGLG